MFLLKQLLNLNVNRVRHFGAAVNQATNFSRIGGFSPYFSSCSNITTKSTTINGPITLNLLRSKTPNTIGIRHHYRNYEYHPNRIVRAYRQTRTWLTDHFVLAENRFENIYSFSFLVTFGVLLCFVGWLNLQVGGEAGDFDTNKLPPKDPVDGKQ